MPPQSLYGSFQLPAVCFPAGLAPAAQKAPQGRAVGQAPQQGLEHVGQVGHEPELVGLAAVHHVLPDDEAQLIAMVVPALGFDLRVLAQEVEAQLLHGLQFVDHRRVGGRSVEAFRPVALVQQAVQQNRLPVQAEAQDALLVRLTAPFPQREIAVHRVEALFAALRRAHGQVVEEGAGRAPREEVLLRDGQGHLAVLAGLVAAPVLGDGHAARPHHGPEVRRAAGLGRVGLDRYGAGIVVRGDGQGLDVVVRHPLQPDGLPDAALGRVEHPAGLERLLAPRLVPGTGGVLHSHPQAVVVGVQRVGDVERKGPVAAPVAAHQMPVDLHRAGVIHGPEVEQHPAALPCGRGKAAVVVEPLAGPERPPHTGGFCLRGVGYQDVAVPLGRELGRFCDGVLPHTVQALEAVPPQRGAGVFRQRVLGSR